MAIAKNGGSHQRLWFKIVAVLVLALVSGWWLYGDGMRGFAQAGTAYGAKNACSCRHISGRDLDSCETDFIAGMRFVMLGEDTQSKSVTASIPLIASNTATYRPGFGCVLEPATATQSPD